MLETEHYCITPENIFVHEMIGLNAKVVQSTDSKKKGINGKVIDETKNTFVIENNGVEKIVPKIEAMFEFIIGNERMIVDGKRIIYKPEQRTKLAWRKMK